MSALKMGTKRAGKTDKRERMEQIKK